LAELAPSAVDLELVETNMVYLDVAPFGLTAPQVADELLALGVITLGPPGTTMRLVTHRDVTSAGIQTALKQFRVVLNPSS
jgi:hypothetical protein